jgi:hypothetical protein
VFRIYYVLSVFNGYKVRHWNWDAVSCAIERLRGEF